MKKISRSHHGTLNELNITPLLDLAFVLLVIFIITTPQLVNHLEMALPSSEATPAPRTPPVEPAVQNIAVTAEGRVLLNQSPVTLPALRTALATLRTSTPDLAVVVKGSDAVNYQSMVEVLDVLRQLDITKVGLATLPEGVR
jgi:biopolymer transport protein ExbD